MNSFDRLLLNSVKERLEWNPVVALLGPRQCGKTTLAKQAAQSYPNTVYLDLELPQDLEKLNEPSLFFEQNPERLIILDEIQRRPELFPVIRSHVDATDRKCRLLILGSASPALLRQSSESLAGRISYLDLTPFLLAEVPDLPVTLHWERGGFPNSLLADDSSRSMTWRQDYVRSLIERDLPLLGLPLAPLQTRRLLMLLAHCHGELLNTSKLGEALGVNHTTFRKYLDYLEGTFIVRTLLPEISNVKKRTVKAPKVYFRDVGILQAVLGIPDFNTLMGHPGFGAS
ncbi:MAG: ATP-binding protein, partial [Fibrobacterota bacterium]